MTITLALVFSLFGPAPAPSESAARDPVLVLPLAAGATVSTELVGDLQATLERGLGRGRLAVVRDPAADACSDDACVRARATAVKAELVLRGSVEETDRNFAVSLRLLDASTLEPVAQSRRDCEVCGSAEVLELLEDQAAALAARPAVGRPVTGALVLRSRPAGATVQIDGEAAGHTPTRRTVAVGPHRVVFRLERHELLVRDVVASAGVDELVDVELVRRRRPAKIAGAVLLGVGLAATGAGGTLLGLDGRPYERRCDGDDVDFAGRCRFRLDTTIPGAVTTAVGVAAVVTGVALLVTAARSRASRRSGADERRPRSRPGAALRDMPRARLRSAAP